MIITVTRDQRGNRYYRHGSADDVQLGWAEIVLEELDIPEEQLFHMAVPALEMGYRNITKYKEEEI